LVPPGIKPENSTTRFLMEIQVAMCKIDECETKGVEEPVF
jgi:hypothetical protein